MQNPGSSPGLDGTGQSYKSSAPSTSLAFLVHSPDTVEKNLPPDVDNKPLARQKRRRTSKEDEEILKSEYGRNPKPDKAARIQIVSQVALSEKEVQIWFQNRRQTDRRRSRPSETFDVLPSSQESDDSNDPGTLEVSEAKYESQGPIAADTNLSPRPLVPTNTVRDAPVLSASISSSTDKASEITAASSQSFTSSQGSSTSSNYQPGYLANRRCASFTRNAEDERLDASNVITIADSTKTLKRSLSFVRLSMTVDGNAKVVTNADGTPSPPRPPVISSRSSTTIQRSQSAVGLNDKCLNASAQNSMPPARRGVQGRSRDSRAWEFWCDSDARNSLTEKAEQEGSGSAADAIGLIRANARMPLQSIPNKRNAQFTRDNSAKRSKADGQNKSRPKLQRAKTSLGRLQSRKSEEDAAASTATYKNSEVFDGAEFETASTESDKENKDPTDQTTSRRKAMNSSKVFQGPRRVLGENTTILSQSSSLGEMLAREKRMRDSQLEDSEKTDPCVGVSGSSKMSELSDHGRHASASSGEELGCAEGLLALSQGNWR